MSTTKNIKFSNIGLLIMWILLIAFFSVFYYCGGWGMIGLYFGLGLVVLSLVSYGISYLLQSRLIRIIYRLWKLLKQNYNFHLQMDLIKKNGKQNCSKSDISLLCLLPVAISSTIVRFLGFEQLLDPVWVFVLALLLFLFVSVILVIIWGFRAVGLVSVGEGNVVRLDHSLRQSMVVFTLTGWLFYVISLFTYFQTFSEVLTALNTLLILCFLIFAPMAWIVIHLHFQYLWNKNKKALAEYLHRKEGLTVKVIEIRVRNAEKL